MRVLWRGVGACLACTGEEHWDGLGDLDEGTRGQGDQRTCKYRRQQIVRGALLLLLVPVSSSPPASARNVFLGTAVVVWVSAIHSCPARPAAQVPAMFKNQIIDRLEANMSANFLLPTRAVKARCIWPKPRPWSQEGTPARPGPAV